MLYGRNPAPVDSWIIPLFIGFQPSKVVQDFFHPPYVMYIIIRILCCAHNTYIFLMLAPWEAKYRLVWFYPVVRRELRSYDYPYSPQKNGSSLRIPVATWKCNVNPIYLIATLGVSPGQRHRTRTAEAGHRLWGAVLHCGAHHHRAAQEEGLLRSGGIAGDGVARRNSFHHGGTAW